MSSCVFEIKDILCVNLLLTIDPEGTKQEKEGVRRVVLATDQFTIIFKRL